MTRLLALICLLILSIPLLAQEGYNVHPYQSNTLCPLAITLTASGSLTYELKFDTNSIVNQGALNAGDTAEMHLPLVTAQWYTLLVEWGGGDQPYTVDTWLDCDGDETPDPAVDVVALREKFEPIFAAFRAMLAD